MQSISSASSGRRQLVFQFDGRPVGLSLNDFVSPIPRCQPTTFQRKCSATRSSSSTVRPRRSSARITTVVNVPRVARRSSWLRGSPSIPAPPPSASWAISTIRAPHGRLHEILEEQGTELVLVLISQHPPHGCVGEANAAGGESAELAGGQARLVLTPEVGGWAEDVHEELAGLLYPPRPVVEELARDVEHLDAALAEYASGKDAWNSRSTAWATAGCCVKVRSPTSGSSRRPATPAARSGRRCSSGISCWTARDRSPARALRVRAFWARRIRADEIESFLKSVGAVYTRHQDESALLERGVAGAREREGRRLVPRPDASSARARSARAASSAIARSPTMQATMNLKIKFRESFRPFAPCVLREHVHEWFGMRPGEDSPYMLLVAPVLDEHRVPLSEEDRGAPTTRSRSACGASASCAAPCPRSRTSTTARASRRSTSGTAASTGCCRRSTRRPAVRSSSTRASTSRGSRSC